MVKNSAGNSVGFPVKSKKKLLKQRTEIQTEILTDGKNDEICCRIRNFKDTDLKIAGVPEAREKLLW